VEQESEDKVPQLVSTFLLPPPPLLRTRSFDHRVFKTCPWTLFIAQLNSAHCLTPYLFQIHSNNILCTRLNLPTDVLSAGSQTRILRFLSFPYILHAPFILSPFYYSNNMVILTWIVKSGNILTDQSLGLDMRIILKRIWLWRYWLDSTCLMTCEDGHWNSGFRNNRKFFENPNGCCWLSVALAHTSQLAA
jgi:hypothetical protein